jgi:hypothetical protein
MRRKRGLRGLLDQLSRDAPRSCVIDLASGSLHQSKDAC